MSDKNGSEGRIQWSRFFKKLFSLHDPEGTFVSEALWSKGVLDTAARAL